MFQWYIWELHFEEVGWNFNSPLHNENNKKKLIKYALQVPIAEA